MKAWGCLNECPDWETCWPIVESVDNDDVGCPDLIHVLINLYLDRRIVAGSLSVFWNGCAINSHWKQLCFLQAFRLISDSLQTSPGLGFWISICVHREISALLFGKWKNTLRLGILYCILLPCTVPSLIADVPAEPRDWALELCTCWHQVNNFPRPGPSLIGSDVPLKVVLCANAKACSFPGLKNATGPRFNL